MANPADRFLSAQVLAVLLYRVVQLMTGGHANPQLVGLLVHRVQRLVVQILWRRPSQHGAGLAPLPLCHDGAAAGLHGPVAVASSREGTEHERPGQPPVLGGQLLVAHVGHVRRGGDTSQHAVLALGLQHRSTFSSRLVAIQFVADPGVLPADRLGQLRVAQRLRIWCGLRLRGADRFLCCGRHVGAVDAGIANHDHSALPGELRKQAPEVRLNRLRLPLPATDPRLLLTGPHEVRDALARPVVGGIPLERAVDLHDVAGLCGLVLCNLYPDPVLLLYGQAGSSVLTGRELRPVGGAVPSGGNTDPVHHASGDAGAEALPRRHGCIVRAVYRDLPVGARDVIAVDAVDRRGVARDCLAGRCFGGRVLGRIRLGSPVQRCAGRPSVVR
ncbi:hypothetical protein GCM10007977_026430 [Dactylosporangium sucinum]|uniref:Uncharacterized protein n=1 Tax=Dactylosporangium sucinum TaxID=1424081 RepID=A0A917TIQ5_9ACTN|nr:hypothetical protein GCM10007977_026430 [Dactylosporangium sucinum]